MFCSDKLYSREKVLKKITHETKTEVGLDKLAVRTTKNVNSDA